MAPGAARRLVGGLELRPRAHLTTVFALLGGGPQGSRATLARATRAKPNCENRGEATERELLAAALVVQAPHRSHIVRFTSIPRTKPIHAMQHAHTHTHAEHDHARRHRQHTYMRQGGRGEDCSPPNHSCQINIATDCMGRPAVWLQPRGEWGCSGRYHHADGCGDGRCAPW